MIVFTYCFRDVMEKSFPEFYDYYLSVINDNSHLNGQNMQVGTHSLFALVFIYICKVITSPSAKIMLVSCSEVRMFFGFITHSFPKNVC